MASIWRDGIQFPSFPALEGTQRTDILIIGGGITGLLCAHMLRQAGIDYILLEAETLCSGVTGNTTAKICSQHGLIYDKLIRELGHEKAQLYLQANQAALAKYRELCRNIDCDFETKASFVYSLHDREKIERECVALDTLGFQADFVESCPLPFSVAGAVRFDGQAQFHPLKFLSHIAPGLKVYENSRVLELAPGTARTARGQVQAEKILVATHFPMLNKHGCYFMKLFQHRSYVLALENAPNVGGMYLDENEKGLSFRNYKEFLLLGGGSHRTGKRGGGWRELEALAERYYPGAAIKYRWAAQDCMSLDAAPYIGPYSKGTEGLYVATGFNKWGMSSSMLAAMLFCDMAQGKPNDYAPVFSPSRSMPLPALAMNLLSSAAGLLSPSQKRCPHMGCALKWNPQEHSWDCPCHGSRFTRAGNLLDGPANGDLKR